MTCVDCGASTNYASWDGQFRCWRCHCHWLEQHPRPSRHPPSEFRDHASEPAEVSLGEGFSAICRPPGSMPSVRRRRGGNCRPFGDCRRGVDLTESRQSVSRPDCRQSGSVERGAPTAWPAVCEVRSALGGLSAVRYPRLPHRRACGPTASPGDGACGGQWVVPDIRQSVQLPASRQLGRVRGWAPCSSSRVPA